jgi:hypothetical protein
VVCREPIGNKASVKRRGEFVHGDCLGAYNAAEQVVAP